MRKVSWYFFTLVRSWIFKAFFFFFDLQNIWWFGWGKFLQIKQILLVFPYISFAYISFLGWWIFNLFLENLIQRKRSCVGYYILRAFLKVLTANCNFSLVHLFSESKDKHENLSDEKQNEHESLQPLPQHSADLRVGRKLYHFVHFSSWPRA